MEFRARYQNFAIQYQPTIATWGTFGKTVSQRGKTLQFVNFRYKTENPEEIKFLRANKGYGITFAEVGESDFKPASVPMVSGSRGIEDVAQDSDTELIPSKKAKKGE